MKNICDSWRYRFLVVLCVGILTNAGCDPCFDLAQRICDCEPTESMKENCKRELEVRKTQGTFEKAKDPKVCERALKSCTCKAITENKVEMCGMTREPSVPGGDENAG